MLVCCHGALHAECIVALNWDDPEIVCYLQVHWVELSEMDICKEIEIEDSKLHAFGLLPWLHNVIIDYSELAAEAKFEECRALCPVLSNYVPHIFVKLGKDGVFYASRGQGRVHFLHYPPASPHLLPVSVVNVTGCGDR